jgi:thioesterase domain-containing protein
VAVFRSNIRSAWLEFFHDHDANGWSDLAPDVKVRTVPGDHFTMWREPNVSVLARQLTECLG